MIRDACKWEVDHIEVRCCILSGAAGDLKERPPDKLFNTEKQNEEELSIR